MKKSDIATMASFAAHVGKVMEAMPYLDSSLHKPGVCNAWRLAKKELPRIRRIIDKFYEDVDTENNASAG